MTLHQRSHYHTHVYFSFPGLFTQPRMQWRGRQCGVNPQYCLSAPSAPSPLEQPEASRAQHVKGGGWGRAEAWLGPEAPCLGSHSALGLSRRGNPARGPRGKELQRTPTYRTGAPAAGTGVHICTVRCCLVVGALRTTHTWSCLQEPYSGKGTRAP